MSSRCEVEPDATGMVLSGVPGAEASHRAAVVRAAGVRVVVVVDDADRDRPSFEAAFRGERDPLVRYAVTGVSATADVDEDTGVPIIAPDQAPGDVGARAFGRRFDPEPGAAGDVRVVDARTGAVLHVVVAGELREPSAGG